MLLADWMVEQDITQTRMAEIIGVRQSYISEYLAGKKGMGKKTAARIVKATNGAVTLEELLFPEKGAA